MASRLSGKSQFPNILEFGRIGPGRCEYLSIYNLISHISVFLASEISISSGYINFSLNLG